MAQENHHTPHEIAIVTHDGELAIPSALVERDRNNFEAELPLSVLRTGDVLGFHYVHEGREGGFSFDVTQAKWRGLDLPYAKPRQSIIGTLHGDVVPEKAQDSKAHLLGSSIGGSSIFSDILKTGYPPAIKVPAKYGARAVLLPKIDYFNVARRTEDGYLKILEPQELEVTHPEINEMHNERLQQMQQLASLLGDDGLDIKDNSIAPPLFGEHITRQIGDLLFTYNSRGAQGNYLEVFDVASGRVTEYFYDPDTDVMKIGITELDQPVTDTEVPLFEHNLHVAKVHSTRVTFASSERFGLNRATVIVGDKDAAEQLHIPMLNETERATIALSIEPGEEPEIPLEYPLTLVEQDNPGTYEHAKQRMHAGFRANGGLDLRFGDAIHQVPTTQELYEQLMAKAI